MEDMINDLSSKFRNFEQEYFIIKMKVFETISDIFVEDQKDLEEMKGDLKSVQELISNLDDLTIYNLSREIEKFEGLIYEVIDQHEYEIEFERQLAEDSSFQVDPVQWMKKQKDFFRENGL